MKRVLFVSKNLIGDALYISQALRELIRTRGLDYTGEVYMQTLPDHVACLYSGMVRGMVESVHLQVVYERPKGTFDFEHTFDVNSAFALSDKTKKHIADCYAELLGVKITSLKPIYIPETLDQSIPSLGYWDKYIIVSIFSASCESRDKNVKGLPPNKMLPFDKWLPLLNYLANRYPDCEIKFVGAPSDKDEISSLFYMYGSWLDIPEMFGPRLNTLAWMMKYCKMVVTIDNGMSHLAASQETSTYLMYPQCLSPTYILPVGNPNLVWVQMNPVTVNPMQLVHALDFACKKFDLLKRSRI